MPPAKTAAAMVALTIPLLGRLKQNTLRTPPSQAFSAAPSVSCIDGAPLLHAYCGNPSLYRQAQTL